MILFASPCLTQYMERIFERCCPARFGIVCATHRARHTALSQWIQVVVEDELDNNFTSSFVELSRISPKKLLWPLSDIALLICMKHDLKSFLRSNHSSPDTAQRTSHRRASTGYNPRFKILQDPILQICTIGDTFIFTSVVNELQNGKITSRIESQSSIAVYLCVYVCMCVCVSQLRVVIWVKWPFLVTWEFCEKNYEQHVTLRYNQRACEE